MTSVGGETWFYSGPSGGNGGNEWHSPYFTSQERLIGVDVRQGSWIDAIGVYTDQQPNQPYLYGGTGGSLSAAFRLQPNERLVRVQGTHGTYVNTLTFTLLDIVSGASRSISVGGHDQGPEGFDYEAPPGIGIAALWGFAGTYLDSIGVNYLPFDSPNF